MEFLDPMVQNLDFGYVYNFQVISYAYIVKIIINFVEVRIVFHYDLRTWLEVCKNKK